MKVINTLPENLRKNATFMKLDVSSFKSIINFVNEVKQKYDKIDILMNNAGAMPIKFDWTEDNYDSYFISLYLGPFLLSALLMNHMNKDGDAKIINLSSAMHLWPMIEKGDSQKYKNIFIYKHFLNENKFLILYIQRASLL
jgi:NAD(P)-dependent dehydrogenase (short-subunit alcohol dehydrogenase family)